MYSAWFYAPESGSWKFIATFRRPNTNSYVASPGSFLEGFNPENGYLTSKAYYSNFWFKESATSGSWTPSTSATFIPDGIAKGNNRQDYQGGIENGAFFMRHNGFFNDYGPNINTSFHMPEEPTPDVDLSSLEAEAQALPVTFGIINAHIKADILKVNWNSLAETNNDFFDIEASVNGTVFKKIGTINSKAANGNSSTAIDYSFDINVSDIAGKLGIPAFAAFLVIGFIGINFKRRNFRNFAFATSLFLTAGIQACDKNPAEALTNDEKEKIFIRIAQVDQNGNTTYSTTVTAIVE
ncbi:DUF3472 domain-containing protein [Niabella hibiscisoli]|nr:DUF3472 domain-containing protein [Niabella hibiscisoli]MCH5718028.1 DUF3472 domain-containing protein [Niabella hibiscisoli]